MAFDAEFTADPIDVHVGAQLRAFRKQRGLSQPALAEALGGITFQQLQKYEHGANRISASRMYRAAAKLGITPNDLFAGLPGVEEVAAETGAARSARLYTNSHEGEALVAAIAALPAERRVLLVEVVQAFRGRA